MLCYSIDIFLIQRLAQMVLLDSEKGLTVLQYMILIRRRYRVSASFVHFGQTCRHRTVMAPFTTRLIRGWLKNKTFRLRNDKVMYFTEVYFCIIVASNLSENMQLNSS